ncbi:hypothetical protein OBBRIDRAFT_798180, partial [Obba rivulosa]
RSRMNDPEVCSPSLHNHSKTSGSKDPVHFNADVSDKSENLSEEDSSEESSSEEGRDIAWVAPRISAGDLEYTIWNLMSVDDHRRNDKVIFDIITIMRGSCPSPEEILNDVDLATCILLLVMRTVARDIPLKQQWRNWDHLHAAAEQEILRKSLVEGIRFKTFMRMRSL